MSLKNPLTQVTAVQSLATDELATRLNRLGTVAIFNHGDGWTCSTEMFVSEEAKGVKFEVKSERQLPDINTAMAQCLYRCHKALESAGQTRP